MSTIGNFVDTRSDDKTNNFLFLRLAAASLVIYGHSPAMSAPCPACVDLVEKYLKYRYSGDLGLHIFFVISGFLIVRSFDVRASLWHFLSARALRILPGLWVCLILSTLVCTFFSTFGFVAYISSMQTIRYLTSNALLYRAVFSLPGVTFTDHNSTFSSVVNGSIWTLFVEARLYLIVAILGALNLISNKLLFNFMAAGFVMVGVFMPSALPFIGEYSENWRVAAFFLAGGFMYVNRYAIPLNWSIFALLLFSAFLSNNTRDFQLFAGIALAYGTMKIAYSRKIRLPNFVQDFSYGIYVYGWPVQQIIAHFWPELGPYRLTVYALFCSWSLGAASWYLIEKRALKLKGNKFRNIQPSMQTVY